VLALAYNRPPFAPLADSPLHLHILGICGTFMGGIAALAREAGYQVTGCDSNVYPPMSDQLSALGVQLIEGYSDDQLALRPDVWVIGNAITRGNPLMEAILDRGERYQSGPEWLREHVLNPKWVFAVAGTHGKTTTSGMLAWILERCGRNPGFLVGGVPADFSISARLTSSDLFVIEADEYDTAFFDKRSKFVHYRPKTAIINNIEFDHADIFDDLASIERQFRHFVRIIPRSGLIVSNATDAVVKQVLTQSWTPIEEFGGQSEWGIGSTDAGSHFEVLWRAKPMGCVKWALTGTHNQMNALAAIVAARHGGVSPEAAIDALSSFSGVRRRMELRGVERGVTVYDDFAHHPTAIRTTLEGLRAKVGSARILAVLEPRSNTMKLGRMKDALPGSLAAADGVYFYASGLEWDPVSLFRTAGREVRAANSVEALVAEIASQARTGDQIVVMSNGGFGGIHGKLLAALRAGAK
jgi:UDP-N-acetylmuramate: L-alanyl-gamma-D-glutamyl-meso-diaminopimelate ligase